jgi:glycosyltransferase involved in cell wall biosynthesis
MAGPNITFCDPHVEVRPEEVDVSLAPFDAATLAAADLVVVLVDHPEFDPSAVHAGTPKAGLLGMVASWIVRVPVRVYAVHGVRYETIRGNARRLFVTLERVACAAATHVAPDSQSLAAVVQRDRLAKAGKVAVIGPGSSNGVDTGRFTRRRTRAEARSELGLDERAHIVGFVGRLTRDKGIDDLVDWYRGRSLSLPAVQLLLVGTLEDGDPVKDETLRTIHSGPGVIHVEWLDDPRVAYEAMDVLAFPSYREGLPNVPLEAQSMSVPVVGYSATGTVDAVADPSTLVPLGDVERLGALLDQLLSSPAEREVSGNEASSWVRENFDRDVVWSAKIDFLSAATHDT